VRIPPFPQEWHGFETFAKRLICFIFLGWSFFSKRKILSKFAAVVTDCSSKWAAYSESIRSITHGTGLGLIAGRAGFPVWRRQQQQQQQQQQH
jgi:hypothetical protein